MATHQKYSKEELARRAALKNGPPAGPSSLPPRKAVVEATTPSSPTQPPASNTALEASKPKGPKAGGLKALPEKPEDFDKLLAPYRVMVRPLVSGVSKIAEVAESLPLDADEKEGGVQAFSALLYQYGGTLDARVLVALWLAGVTIPRVIHGMKQKKERDEKKKKELREGPAPLRVVEKEVNPPPS